ncbi:uncharacterized protein [Anabrus simplex]|uniref:uncharacterized protein isoform X1 n=1 Tax=Anabrus simplex TaxID=316456 RepID=UPI0035A38EDC
MDHKVKIKEEPVGLQEIASRPTSSPSADVKDELIIEEPTLDQLLPYFKEEEIMSAEKDVSTSTDVAGEYFNSGASVGVKYSGGNSLTEVLWKTFQFTIHAPQEAIHVFLAS